MDHEGMQRRVDEIASKITATGRKGAECRVTIESHCEMKVVVRYGKYDLKTLQSDGEVKIFRGTSPEDLFNQARQWVDARPSLEEEKHHAFMRKVGHLLDEAREKGIKADFVNPLEVLMKDLSENVLTHHEPFKKEPDPDDEIPI